MRANRPVHALTAGALVLCAALVAGSVFASSTGRFSRSLRLHKRVALLRINGPIFESQNYVRLIRHYSRDRSIAGLLLAINSPGGGVAPSQEVYRELQRFRRSGKPLVVSMGSVAASGGYYIAACSDRIFANPGTITGSIGVVMEAARYYKLLGKVGVQIETLKSGKYKDIGSPTRDMTPEDRALLQGVIDDTHRQFIEDVSTARGMPIDSVKALADGRIYTGRQACRVGLVDTLGSYLDALDYLRSRCGLSDRAPVVERRQQRQSLLESLVVEDVLGLSGLLSRLASASWKNTGGLFYLYETP